MRSSLLSLNFTPSTLSLISATTTTSPEDILTLPENYTHISIYSRNCVIAYIFLFFIGASCNLSIFFSVGRQLWQQTGVELQTRIKLLIWNLAIADLLVCFVVIPTEVVWRLTVQWYGGDVLCKVAQFFRAFGLYSSSMVIVCISLDRFLAIVFPLSVIGGTSKRVHHMLAVAWSCAFIFSTPQLMMYSVQGTVFYPTFKQCTSNGYFSSLSTEIYYNLFSLAAMYGIPLATIIVTYAMVLYTMIKKASLPDPHSGFMRSDKGPNVRARNRTLIFSMIIVTTFVFCWTPYVTMVMWYLFDNKSVDKQGDPRIHEALFVTVVSNSCMNPIIYGNYMKKYWRNLRYCCRKPTTQSLMSTSYNSSSHHHHQYQRHSRAVLLQLNEELREQVDDLPILSPDSFDPLAKRLSIEQQQLTCSTPLLPILLHLQEDLKDKVNVITCTTSYLEGEKHCCTRCTGFCETTI